jgi:hypothetical protein
VFVACGFAFTVQVLEAIAESSKIGGVAMAVGMSRNFNVYTHKS